MGVRTIGIRQLGIQKPKQGSGQSWSSYCTPLNLTATIISDTEIQLDWTNVDTTGDGAKIYISTDEVNYTLKNTVALGVSTVNVTGLTAGVKYTVKIVAYKAAIESSGAFCFVTIPSLLSDLVFSLKWNGAAFENAVTGLEMVDHGSVVSGLPIVANSEETGVFVTANSKYLSTPNTPALTMGDIDFMVAVRCNLTSVTTNQCLIGQYLSTGDQRAWAVIAGRATNNVFSFQVSSNGTSGSFEVIDSGAISNNVNYFILAWHDASANTINIQVNNGNIYSKSWTGGVFNSSADLTVGAIANPLYYAGGRITADIWKRKLTALDISNLWGGGNGNKYPFNLFPVELNNINKVVLMGDKSGGEDITVSQSVNTVLMSQIPDMIIGTGDYDGQTLTMEQLLTNLTAIKYASPGNHDDWTSGNRTEFNANFNYGGYKHLKTRYVDFFIYDYYLKTNESGYYTLAEALAVSQSDRQASTQGQWLINSIAASTAKWKVIITHIPPHASPSDYSVPGEVVEATNMQWDWYALGADLILSGHFHFYERLLKNTGSGNVTMLITGNTGTNDSLGWTSVDADSEAIFNEVTDTDFEGGMLVVMDITAINLTINLSAIKSDYSIVSGKDQIILN